MGFSETHDTVDKPLPVDLIPGYKFYSKPRGTGRGGGVGMAVHKCVATDAKPYAFSGQQYPESFWLVLQRSGRARKLFVGFVYMPDESKPAEQRRTAWHQLSTDLSHLTSQGAVICMGDFNARVGVANEPNDHIGTYGEATENSNGRMFKNMLGELDLYALNARSLMAPAAAQTSHLTYIKYNANGTVMGQSLN